MVNKVTHVTQLNRLLGDFKINSRFAILSPLNGIYSKLLQSCKPSQECASTFYYIKISEFYINGNNILFILHPPGKNPIIDILTLIKFHGVNKVLYIGAYGSLIKDINISKPVLIVKSGKRLCGKTVVFSNTWKKAFYQFKSYKYSPLNVYTINSIMTSIRNKKYLKFITSKGFHLIDLETFYLYLLANKLRIYSIAIGIVTDEPLYGKSLVNLTDYDTLKIDLSADFLIQSVLDFLKNFCLG